MPVTRHSRTETANGGAAGHAVRVTRDGWSTTCSSRVSNVGNRPQHPPAGEQKWLARGKE